MKEVTASAARNLIVDMLEDCRSGPVPIRVRGQTQAWLIHPAHAVDRHHVARWTATDFRRSMAAAVAASRKGQVLITRRDRHVAYLISHERYVSLGGADHFNLMLAKEALAMAEEDVFVPLSEAFPGTDRNDAAVGKDEFMAIAGRLADSILPVIREELLARASEAFDSHVRKLAADRSS